MGTKGFLQQQGVVAGTKLVQQCTLFTLQKGQEQFQKTAYQLLLNLSKNGLCMDWEESRVSAIFREGDRV